MRARAVCLLSAMRLCDLCCSMYGWGSGDPLGGVAGQDAKGQGGGGMGREVVSLCIYVCVIVGGKC